MAGEISGVVTDIDGNPVQGATVYAIKTDVNPSEVVGDTTTDSSGNYLFNVPYGGEFTVVAEWDDGGTTYNSRSRSFVPVSRSEPNPEFLVSGGTRAQGPSADAGIFDGFQFNAISDMTTARIDFDSASTGGSLYAACGRDNSFNELATVEVWDGSTWSTITNSPTTRFVHAVAADSNGNIFLCGGDDGIDSASATVDMWDGSTWTSIADMPAGKRDHCAAGDNSGNIFVIAGADSGFNDTSTVFRWDGSSWASATNIPTARSFPAAASGPSGGVYVAGGRGSNNNLLDDIQRWDGSSWSFVTNIPTPLENFAMGVDDDQNIYIAGGTNASGATSYVRKWDGSSWEVIDRFSSTVGGPSGACL